MKKIKSYILFLNEDILNDTNIYIDVRDESIENRKKGLAIIKKEKLYGKVDKTRLFAPFNDIWIIDKDDLNGEDIFSVDVFKYTFLKYSDNFIKLDVLIRDDNLVKTFKRIDRQKQTKRFNL